MLRFLNLPDIRQGFRKDRRRLAGAVLAFTGRALLALAGPKLIGHALNVIINDEGFDALQRTTALIVTFAIATAFCQWWMRWLWIGWSREVEQRMRDRTFVHLVRLPVSFFDRNRVGDLMSRLTSDIEAIRMGYGPGIMHFVQPFLMTIGALSFMLAQSVRLTAVALCPLVLLFIGMKSLLPRIHEYAIKVQERQADLSTRAQETFSGMRVIQAFAREQHECQRFDQLSAAYMQDALTHARIRGLFRCLIEGFAGLGLVLVLLFAGLDVLKGRLTIGDFAEFQGFLTLLIWPMIALGWTLALFQRAEGAATRIRSVLGESPLVPEWTDQAENTAEPVPDVTLRVKDLTFAYPGQTEPVLHGISFELKPGGTLGIVGATASGKTTFVSLLLRNYDPPRGTIFLGKEDLLDIPLEKLRKTIAIVPQESFLFSDTLESNIAFGRDDWDPDSVQEAAERSRLLQDADAFPEGLKTEIGERGVTLSGGQRQRTSIARGLLMNSPVLVLDDALSSVDTETESAILEGLRPVLRNRTSIIVAHRLSSVAHADHVLVLEHGRVVEAGHHEELIRAGGTYARLWSLQQDERDLDRL